MPPDWDSDFCENVELRTHPISVPSYRMAPVKLRELKNQLQKLLNKTLIHPSAFSYGDPVLFVRKRIVS